MEAAIQHLSAGARIDRYRVLSILGIGGFGITYLAEDPKLNQKVAIKEYLPGDLSVRGADSISVQARSHRVDEFEYGLKRFVEEARTLAKFKHLNIVRVGNFIEAHGTAYLVMDYEAGESLSDYLKRIRFSGGMAETEIRSVMLPILKGLQAVHAEGLLHRDVKPGNIYLRRDGEPMLIDFGAARYALGEHSRSISAIVSMGYAPPEQYSTRSKQGPWSDLYAWGATVYELMTGKAPVESPDRSHALAEEDPDPLRPVNEVAQARYSPELIKAVEWCLQLAAKRRPKEATEVLGVLTGVQPPTITATRVVKEQDRFSNEKIAPPPSMPAKPNEVPKKTRIGFYAGICVAVLVVLGATVWQLGWLDALLESSPMPVIELPAAQTGDLVMGGPASSASHKFCT